MVYAAVGVLPPEVTPEIELAIVETRKSPGVVHVICYPGVASEASGSPRPEVAVVARGYWLARQALARLMERCGGPFMTAPGSGTGLDHACMARVTRATAHFVDGRLRLWVATADMAQTRALVAKLSGVPEEYVDLRVTGEAEGTTSLDVLTAALALAKELQSAPVQVILAPVVAVPLPAVAPRAEPAAAGEIPAQALAA